ncbi:MAG: glutamine synthetase family protein [Actinomycetota bacterium]|nr:glutamine synthetase family protein [Actinomycetota bacterium]
MDLDTLRGEADAGRIDTVLLAMTDMQGRLQGKRLTVNHFLQEVVEEDAEGCNYLLAVDVDMETVEGYAMSSWSGGYGDFVFKPDMQTLRLIPWLEGTALVTCDLVWEDGSPVVASPRQILKRQLERLAERGFFAFAGTELEFIVFRNTYEEAWRKAYRDLEPANYYNVDYSLLGTTRIEPLLRRIRNCMLGAGLMVEDAKGECNYGQHEINVQFDGALAAADGHSVYKNGAKEIASQMGYALTFMPKFNELEGNSCHIHLSLQNREGEPVFPAGEAGGHGFSETFKRFLAGQLACMREMTLFFAPNINSYKRYARGSFVPTAVAWGPDNRTCSLRVIGHGKSLRVENRAPGGDVNPYLALSAMIAAGIHGLDNELGLEEGVEGNAYEVDKPQLPSNMYEARDLFTNSAVAREAFGDEVVDHYTNMAQVEIDAFESAVTDWERYRNFERL